MKQGMEMKVNRLPMRTWNWLHMNDSSLSDIDTEIYGKNMVSCNPQFTLPGQGVSCIRGMSAGTLEAGFQEIPTGMGPDMDELVRESETPMDIFRIKRGAHPEEALRLSWQYKQGENSLHAVCIYAEEGSSITVIMENFSGRKDSGSAGIQTKVYAEKNAAVRLIQVQLLGDGFAAMNDVGGICEEGASIELLQLQLGAKTTYAGARINLAGDASRMKADIGYLGKNTQKLDMNYVAEHHGRKSESQMEVKGVLRDQASKLFRGTIDFHRGCSGAEGTEKEEVLLLGDDVVNRTIPLILCGEENVQGNHGATAGKLDEEKLFYFCSRGLSREEACDMMARAGIDALCAKIPDDTVVRRIQKYLEGGSPDEKLE